LRWSTGDIADAVARGLEQRARQDDLEQVVYGFDYLDELGLHPLIQQSLRDAGYAVFPEQRYPDDGRRRKRSEGKRCDLVLGEDPRSPALRHPHVELTLFDHDLLTHPESAFWMEVKTVAQFETGGPFPRYSAELLSAVAQDLKKLRQDSGILHAGLLLVLFTASEAIAAHDLAAWHQRCLDRGYPIGPPAVRGLGITDRIGNAWCAVGVFAVKGY
jgi:hypothetical protein